MNSNQLIVVQSLGILLLATLSFFLLSLQNVSLIVLGLGGIALTVAVFRIRESFLPILLLLVLSLGSSYRWDIVERSLFIRFFFLGLIAIRGIVSLYFVKPVGDHPRGRMSLTLLHVCILFVPFVGLASSYISIDPTLTVQRALSFLMLCFVIFFYFWQRTPTISECEEFTTALWKTLVIILGVGFLFLIARVPDMFLGGRMRLIIQNPNQLGHYVALMSPIAVWRLFDKATSKRRWVEWGVVIAGVIALVGSGSRGALLATLFALLAQFVLCYRTKLMFLLLTIGLIGSVHFLLGDPAPRPGEDPSYFEENVLRSKSLATGSERTAVWQAALLLIDKKPLFGYGFGITDRLFQKGYFPNLPYAFQGAHIHNGYLEELVNLGWIGTIPLFMAFIYLWILGMGALFVKVSKTPNFHFACALFCVVIAATISGVVESWFTSVGSVFCFPFWFVSALFVKTVRSFKDWHD